MNSCACIDEEGSCTREASNHLLAWSFSSLPAADKSDSDPEDWSKTPETLNQHNVRHFSYYISIVFSGLLIHHAWQKHFYPPRVVLNCCCACTGEGDERTHICLSFSWVAKRLLIPQNGDDFPNKSLPKRMRAPLAGSNGKHNGKITQTCNIL